MQAVIFDFDGVIVDSEPVHEAAIRDALAEIGVPARWTDWSRFVGLGDRDTFARMLSDEGREMDEVTYARLRDAKSRSIAPRLARGEAPAHPGAVDLIREASASLPAAVCSGSRRSEVAPVLESLGILTGLRTVVTADDVRRTKPDPEPYLCVAHRLGVAPEQCLVIEDTPVGVRAARAAGCVVAAVGHTAPPDALRDAGASVVVKRIGAMTLAGLRKTWEDTTTARSG